MFDFDPAELGLQLDETQAKALKEALGGKVQQYLDTEVAGLKSKNQELLGANKTLKTDLDQFKGQFEGLDIGAVKSLLQKASQDEETRLLAEGKLDEVISKRTERLRADLDKQLQAEKDRADKAESFAKRFSDKVLADSIRGAALKAGALPEASEDIILRAKGTFTLNENGEAVAVDADGQVIYGKDGKTPLSPLEWAESLRETASHLWPRAQGAGPTGDNGGKAAKKWGDLNEVERARLAREKPEEFKKLMATRGQ
ncbi:hypothetical protein [Stutzerimonas nitrititolerans]|uniref:hypothetical protein n=1 Tax=Stutzerimonas nitrititolerans TaxID=2482751 RepID=UPI0028A1F185|nr:hypothetical protein [Stutzerimonas nitrititolerans]